MGPSLLTTAIALPHGRLQELLKQYGRLEEGA